MVYLTFVANNTEKSGLVLTFLKIRHPVFMSMLTSAIDLYMS